MKGIIIYVNDLRGINAVKLKNASFCCEFTADDITDTLKGTPVLCESATCNKSDTYDFEVGALIALMKMCGRDKVIKACDELYRDDKYKNALQEMTENNEKLMEELNELKKDADKVIDELVEENEKLIIVAKNVLYNKLEKERDLLMVENDRRLKDKLDLKEKYVALKAENEKLKLDCEKLQPSIRDQLDSLLESSKYAIPYTTEWIKPPTKREEMWDKIFAIYKEKGTIIVVKKEDINTFLHEIENKNPEITWATGDKIFEIKHIIKDIYIELKHCDTIYFNLRHNRKKKQYKLSYSTDPYIYPYYEFEHIPYLPPMRWDLFEKGRIYILVKPEHFEEFQKACKANLERGKAPNAYYFNDDSIVVNLPKEGRFCVTKDLKGFKKRLVVNWEDVR